MPGPLATDICPRASRKVHSHDPNVVVDACVYGEACRCGHYQDGRLAAALLPSISPGSAWVASDFLGTWFSQLGGCLLFVCLDGADRPQVLRLVQGLAPRRLRCEVLASGEVLCGHYVLDQHQSRPQRLIWHDLQGVFVNHWYRLDAAEGPKGPQWLARTIADVLISKSGGVYMAQLHDDLNWSLYQALHGSLPGFLGLFADLFAVEGGRVSLRMKRPPGLA